MQNLFPPKGSQVNAQQRKKWKRKAKEAGRRESDLQTMSSTVSILFG